MPANIILRNLTPSLVKGLTSPIIATRSDLRGGVRAEGEALFVEDFSAQPVWVAPEPADWTYFRWAGDPLPAGWDALWNSGSEYPANGNLEIAPSTLGAPGNVLKIWREWHSTNTFASNGYLAKLFAQDYDEMYIEFEIAFMPGWTWDDGATSKVFRMFSSDRDPVAFFQAFSGGNQGPILFWDYSTSGTYGQRNFLAFRGGPHGENYAMDNTDLVGLGRNIIPGSLGGVDMNWTENLQGTLSDGSSPQVPDKLNGGFLPTTGIVWHEQVFGVSGTWTKLGFYVKMNSAPDVADGIFRQYLDDQLVVDCELVRWVGPTTAPMPGWNAFSIGGNDSWTGGKWTSADQREEFYEVRRVAAYNGLPAGL